MGFSDCSWLMSACWRTCALDSTASLSITSRSSLSSEALNGVRRRLPPQNSQTDSKQLRNLENLLTALSHFRIWQSKEARKKIKWLKLWLEVETEKFVNTNLLAYNLASQSKRIEVANRYICQNQSVCSYLNLKLPVPISYRYKVGSETAVTVTDYA